MGLARGEEELRRVDDEEMRRKAMEAEDSSEIATQLSPPHGCARPVGFADGPSLRRRRGGESCVACDNVCGRETSVWERKREKHACTRVRERNTSV